MTLPRHAKKMLLPTLSLSAGTVLALAAGSFGHWRYVDWRTESRSGRKFEYSVGITEGRLVVARYGELSPLMFGLDPVGRPSTMPTPPAPTTRAWWIGSVDAGWGTTVRPGTTVWDIVSMTPGFRSFLGLGFCGARTELPNSSYGRDDEPEMTFTESTTVTVHLGYAVVALAGWPGYVAVRKARGWRGRRLPGQCRKCGYDLRASAGRCPECGEGIVAVAGPGD